MGSAQTAKDKDRDKTRRLVFTDQALLFQLLYESFLTRGSNRDRRVSIEDKRSEARILRALKEVSEPVGPDQQPGALDTRTRKLTDGGGAIELEGKDYHRLLKYVQESQNPSGFADLADDLEQLLLNAEKVEA